MPHLVTERDTRVVFMARRESKMVQLAGMVLAAAKQEIPVVVLVRQDHNGFAEWFPATALTVRKVK